MVGWKEASPASEAMTRVPAMCTLHPALPPMPPCHLAIVPPCYLATLPPCPLATSPVSEAMTRVPGAPCILPGLPLKQLVPAKPLNLFSLLRLLCPQVKSLNLKSPIFSYNTSTSTTLQTSGSLISHFLLNVVNLIHWIVLANISLKGRRRVSTVYEGLRGALMCMSMSAWRPDNYGPPGL